MYIFSYHIVTLPYISAIKLMLLPIKPKNIKGLIHAQTMSAMTLGSSVYAASRFFDKNIIVFAQWDNELALDNFLDQNPTGKKLKKGWYVKLDFIRQWGSFSGFKIPKVTQMTHQNDNPVIAVTLARMKFFQIPRFIYWGLPVEKLVRDHSGTLLSLASIRHPNTISTFSIWKSEHEMTNMVHGHSAVPLPKRHSNAMKERERKDFHFEFTTLRFIPISEHGQWKSKTNFIPTIEK
jgi:hypothetical protein